MTLTSPTAARALAVVAAATAVATAAVALVAPALAASATARPLGPDDALVAGSAALALLATAWLWTATCVVAVAAAHGRGTHVRGVPVLLRRAVLAGCGVALASGLALPAGATPGSPHEAHAPLSGLPFPDRAVHGRAIPHAPVARVRVTPGDSLWSIAEDDLGPATTDAEVAAHWREIYRLNRAEIGPDPDLIRPAQRLRLPHA